MRLFAPFAVILMAIALALTSCHMNAPKTGGADSLATFNKDSLAASISILGSDSFQGRRPFTTGETRTIDYLVNSCKKLGLEPGNGNNYTQDVPMVEISPAAPPTLQLISKKGTTGFQNLNDFVL